MSSIDTHRAAVANAIHQADNATTRADALVALWDAWGAAGQIMLAVMENGATGQDALDQTPEWGDIRAATERAARRFRQSD